MKAGFYNIPVKEEAKGVLGIVTQDGLFQYKRMPFGLTAAPLWFQYVMDTLLGRGEVDRAKAFIDDVTLHGRCAEWRNLWADTIKVMRLLVEAGFMINLRKCKFLVVQAVILGYQVRAAGYRLSDKFLGGWNELKIPTTLKELQGLLGKLLWASPFIPGFKELVDPIEKLLSAGGDHRWT